MKKRLTRLLALGISAALVSTTLCGCSIPSDVNAADAQQNAQIEDMDQMLDATWNKVVNMSGAGENGKEETVYAFADANGTVQSVVVSNWLKNGDGKNTIEDVSSLSDIENVKGDETFHQGADGKITWNANGNDIYYQGNSDKELPVNVKVTYYLDGKETAPEDMAGASGKVEIRFEYENLQKETITDNGEEKEVTVPFLVVSGMLLSGENVSNVQVDHGKVMIEGENIIAAGMAFPGMNDSLKLSEYDALGEDTELPESVTITMDAVDFQVDMSMTLVTDDLLTELDTAFVDTEEVDDQLGTLTSAGDQLTDGSRQLLEGIRTLHVNMGPFSEGIQALQNGLKEYTQGTSALAGGIDSAAQGVDAVDDGAKTVSNGADSVAAGASSLKKGTQSVKDGAALVSDGVQQLTGVLGNTSASLQENYEECQTGISQANAGIAQLDDGIAQLDAGIAQVETGMKQYQDAADASLNEAKEEAEEESPDTAKIQELLNTAQGAMAERYKLELQKAGLEDQKAGLEAQKDAVLEKLGMAEGAAQVDETVLAGLNENAKDLNQLTAGAKSLAGGTSELYDGASQLADGTAQLSQGAKSLSEGTSSLNAGAKKLQAGASELTENNQAILNGALELAKGSIQITDGTSALSEGASQLADGMEQLNEEGIQKLTDMIEEEAEPLLEHMDEIRQAADAYKSYSGIADGMDGTVKFLIKTEGITK